MKKILSLSIIALLAIAPTMGWAEVGAGVQGWDNNTNSWYPRYPDAETMAENANGGTVYHDYEMDMPDTENLTESGNPRSNENGEIGYYYRQGPNGAVHTLVDQNGPIYKGVNVSAEDGKKVSAVSYVKGAYNDVITKINGVNNSLEVYTTWGNASEHKTAVRKD